MAQQTPDHNCPKCGMPMAQASDPTTRNGQTYCCQGCSNGSQCTCPGHSHA